jgi:hypothetical protein
MVVIPDSLDQLSAQELRELLTGVDSSDTLSQISVEF